MYAFVLGGLIIYALVSLVVAAATFDDCGEGAPKEWQFVPPQWECTGPYWGG